MEENYDTGVADEGEMLTRIKPETDRQTDREGERDRYIERRRKMGRQTELEKKSENSHRGDWGGGGGKGSCVWTVRWTERDRWIIKADRRTHTG